MASARASAIARHVEAAQRLLGELERHAEEARHALGSESGAEFFAAVDARDRILGQLDEVVANIAQDRAQATVNGAAPDAATSQLLTEMAQAAARALESNEQLQLQAGRERIRLGTALQRVDRPDTIASQYALSARSARPLSFSVTG